MDTYKYGNYTVHADGRVFSPTGKEQVASACSEVNVTRDAGARPISRKLARVVYEAVSGEILLKTDVIIHGELGRDDYSFANLKKVTLAEARIPEGALNLDPAEDWRDLYGGYEAAYKVSNRGNIYSVSKGANIAVMTNAGGYLVSDLFLNGAKKRVATHRLIYQSFHGEIEAGIIVRHIGELDDNSIDNLVAVTAKENKAMIAEKKAQSGGGEIAVNSAVIAKVAKSTRNAMRPVNKIDIVSGDILETYDSVSSAAQTESARKGISNVCNGTQKSALGYMWKFA